MTSPKATSPVGDPSLEDGPPTPTGSTPREASPAAAPSLGRRAVEGVRNALRALFPASEAELEQARARLEQAYRDDRDNICRFVQRRGVADADSCTQDIFLRALEKLPRYRPDQEFRPWLFGIMRWVVKEHLKKSAKRRECATPDAEREPDQPARDPSDQEALRRYQRAGDAPEVFLLVWRVLEELPEEQSEILALYEFEGLTYPEIGAWLKIDSQRARREHLKARAVLLARLQAAPPRASAPQAPSEPSGRNAP